MHRWGRVIFTGEYQFTVFCSDGRRRVYRRRGERFSDACVLEKDRFGAAIYGVGRDIAWVKVINKNDRWKRNCSTK